MHLYKQIRIRFNLNKIYDGSTSEEEFLLQQLKQKYENICAFDCYVEEIVRVTSHTLCMANMNDLYGSFQVDIAFVARVIVYRPGEMLSNVKLIKKNEQVCGIIAPHTNVIITPSLITNELGKENDNPLIPIIVDSATYPDNHKTVNVIGVFKPQLNKQEPVYTITSDLSELERAILLLMVEQIKKIKIPESKKAERYRHLLYPFKSIKHPTGETLDFLEEKNWSLIGKRVIYPIETSRDIPTCNIDEGKEQAIAASAFSVLNIYLGMHYSHLLLLDNLCTNYPDPSETPRAIQAIFAAYYQTKPA